MKKRIVFFVVFCILLAIITGICLFYFTNHNINNLNSSNMINYIADENNLISDSNNEIDGNITLPTVTETKNYEEDLYEGEFELPLNGTTAFASVSLPLYKVIPNPPADETQNVSDNSIKESNEISYEKILNDYLKSILIKNLNAGQAFKILKESSNWFYIELSNSSKGWIESKYCLVNLPDLIPSIVYNDTNSYSSIFRSSGYDLDGITGNALYNVKLHNSRLEKDEYLMPLLYPMVKKIAKIQKEALNNGDSLIIYETFRPYEVQMKVSNSLSNLMKSNETVKEGITGGPWNKGWFIATQLSNHQRGVALDVSLVKVNNIDYSYCGPYAYKIISDYEEYKMPTAMHELSQAAATFTSPVNSKSKTAWKSAKLASSMTDGANKLQNYFTSFGLTPLASEWWHFNDLDTQSITKDHSSNGKYYLKECLSQIPTN